MKLLTFTLLLAVLTAPACLGQAEMPTDKYGGVLSLTGQKTGWFHVEEIKGRWYFVTPEGHAFFSLGATHAFECIRLDELNLFETRYGKSEERLSDFFLKQFKEWEYNSSGYGPTVPMEQHLPYVATIWTEGPRSLSAGDRSRNTDILDPAVQERLRQKIRAGTERHVANPRCLGYVLIDLPIWSVIPVRGPSYVDFVRALGPATSGKKAYVEFLEKRYDGRIQALNEVYAFKGESFPALLNADMTAATPKQSRIAEDDEAFLNQLADAYYTCVVGELRKSDPNHLVLGDRLMALPDRTPNSVLKTAAKHVDALSFQPMGTQKMLREYMDRAFQLTGKPVLLADVNTMTRRPAKNEADTTDYEQSAGEHTMAYYLDAAASKACIGIHRCTVRDYQPWNPESPRRGLLKADDTPYPILVEYTRRTNRRVYDLVYDGAYQTVDPAKAMPHTGK